MKTVISLLIVITAGCCEGCRKQQKQQSSQTTPAQYQASRVDLLVYFAGQQNTVDSTDAGFSIKA